MALSVKHPAKLDLGDFLPYLVNRVGTIVAEQFGEHTLAPHRLSIAMWRVMAVLASEGSQRQIDLADLTSIDASTLSRIVASASIPWASGMRRATSVLPFAEDLPRPLDILLRLIVGEMLWRLKAGRRPLS